jgi:hypothetical protein
MVWQDSANQGFPEIVKSLSDSTLNLWADVIGTPVLEYPGGKYLLETSATDGYLLEDSSGVLIKEETVASVLDLTKSIPDSMTLSDALLARGEHFLALPDSLTQDDAIATLADFLLDLADLFPDAMDSHDQFGECFQEIPDLMTMGESLNLVYGMNYPMVDGPITWDDDKLLSLDDYIPSTSTVFMKPMGVFY